MLDMLGVNSVSFKIFHGRSKGARDQVILPHSYFYCLAIGSASYIVKNEEGKDQEYIFAIFPSYEVGRAAIAEQHLLRAVVVHSKRYTYLRPFPHETPYRNLVC